MIFQQSSMGNLKIWSVTQQFSITILEVSFILIYDVYSKGITYDDCQLMIVIMFIVQAIGLECKPFLFGAEIRNSLLAQPENSGIYCPRIKLTHVSLLPFIYINLGPSLYNFLSHSFIPKGNKLDYLSLSFHSTLA